MYFQVHQPRRVKRYRIFDIGSDHHYFNDDSDGNLNNRKILEKVTKKCYLPTNAILTELLEKNPDFKVSFSFSGIFLEQLEEYLPDVLSSFQKLIKAGGKGEFPRVEILSETYYHSLSFLYSKEEFRSQVKLHRERIKSLFGREPVSFRNTELIYNNDIGKEVEAMGYRTVLTEGVDNILGWRSPNFIYQAAGTKHLRLLLKNYRLSDDIAFRFSSKEWSDYPLTAPKFAQWISSVNGNGEVVNLFMDYETFGEHQWEDTGIFEFLKSMPREILSHPDNRFVTPDEAVTLFPARDTLDIPGYISWADIERDLSAWRSNPIQHDALRSLYALEKRILQSGDKNLIEDWRRLQTSDHFYYMCTKWWNDGDVHKYFNPYSSPYEAFISYMNVLKDLELRLKQKSNRNRTRKSVSG